MNALEAILRRPRSVLTMMVVLVFSGIYVYLTIPKEADPDIQVPVLYVSITQEGISPEDAERLLIKPMESELRGLDGLKELTATGSQGHAGIILEFRAGVDPEAASQDVREKVDLARGELPGEADEPVVHEINLSLFPVIVVTLSGDVPERTLYQHARKLKDEIEGLPTVLQADLSGHREELLEIVIDSLRLESYSITQQELISAITRNNRLIAAGALDSAKGRFNIKVPGLFETARDVYNLPVKVSGEGVVTLSDVAEIRRTFKDASSFARHNGKPAIAISVIKRLGANIVDNNDQVRKTVTNFTSKWPKSIRVDFTLDQSKTIFEILGSLESAILTAIALVMIVVVAALGLRSALMVGLAIPSSFMIGFLLVAGLGMTLNMMLMFGMVLTVGILVDGAIVIVEYADRKMAEGLERAEAYILAAKRMFWPIVSSTATTLAAFVPMLLWPGVSGEFMSYLPITVILVLSASLVTAMVFLSVIGGLIGKSEDTDVEALRALAGETDGDITRLGGPAGWYARILNRAVHHPTKVVAAAIVLMVGIVALFGATAPGVRFFVDTEPEQAVIFISARGNLSAREELAVVRQVENIVLKVRGVDSVFTATGGGGGGPNIGAGVGQDVPKDQVGQITIELAPYETRRKGALILQEIRERTAPLPGIRVEVRKREDGPPTGKAVRLQVRADDRARAYAAARRIRRHFETVNGLIDIEDELPLPGFEWVLKVDREQAGRFQADIASVGTLIQLVTNGVLVGTYRPNDARDEIDIRVRFPADERSVNRLDTLRLQTPAGLVPISNFVTRKARQRVDSVTRKDGRPSIYVKANTAPGVLASAKVAEIRQWLDAQTWPDDVRFKFRGADEEQKESGAFLAKAMVGALFLMFIILLTQFNSFYHTVITLSTVVMSVVGVLVGMMVTGQDFSVIMTGTGIVALAGIVVNNSIVLIDTYHRLRDSGLGVIDAVLRSSTQRLRPVLLTTLTTICGLLPMALQINLNFFDRSISFGSVTSIWWVQLSTAIIFGLGFATLLTLVLTPVLLAAPTVYRENYAAWRGGPKRAPAGKSPARPKPRKQAAKRPASRPRRVRHAAE